MTDELTQQPPTQVRFLASQLGLGAAAFGVLPLIAPRTFARLFGIETASHSTADAAIRSVAVRDLLLGMGLWSAATHGGNYVPWLMARALADGGDAAATLLAIAQGGTNARFKMLFALASGATATGAVLWAAARRNESAPGS